MGAAVALPLCFSPANAIPAALVAWKELSTADKKPFEERAKQDRVRYDTEMKDYVPSEVLPEVPAPKSSKAVDKPKRASKAKAVSMPEQSEEEEEQDTDGLRLPKLSATPSPMLEESTVVPWKVRQMRRPKYKEGQKVVWFPQAVNCFNEAYAQELLQLELPGLPNSSGALMTKPMDGTANAALVVGMESLGDDFPGWSLLRLQSIQAFQDDDDSAMGEEYSLPVVDPFYCDVDQHVCTLSHYIESRDRLASGSSHVSVFFATPPTALGQPATEDEWEGRVFLSEVHDPEDFPHSTYKSARVVWSALLPHARAPVRRTGPH